MHDKSKKSHKKEFSKLLLIQESFLIWIISLAFLVLAFKCVNAGFGGALPWLSAMISFPWAAYGVSQVFYYKKSLAENTKDGIKYAAVLKDLENAFENASYNNTQNYTASTADIDPFGPIC